MRNQARRGTAEVFAYNVVEIAIWAACGIGFLLAGFRRGGKVQQRCTVTAIVFFSFGASDGVELVTGAVATLVAFGLEGILRHLTSGTLRKSCSQAN